MHEIKESSNVHSSNCGTLCVNKHYVTLRHRQPFLLWSTNGVTEYNTSFAYKQTVAVRTRDGHLASGSLEEGGPTSRTIVRTSFIFRSTELTSIEYVYRTMWSRQRSAPE